MMLVLSGCGSGDPTAIETPPPQGPTPTPTPTYAVAFRLDFESASASLAEGEQVADAGGRGPGGTVRLAGDSPWPVRVVEGSNPGGKAAHLAEPCPPENGSSCPKAIIEVPDALVLNPGPADFRFGASILLATRETSKGSNVVQKGFSTGGGSQWKLQVDGAKGKPSCVVVGTDADAVHEATSTLSVADSRWHEIICSRSGQQLTIEIDGVEAGSASLPPGLVISPDGPVRLGGKNVKPDNDQYFGALDDVFFSVPEG